MGLYDDDNAAITSGDQNSEAFWWARCYSNAFDEALKSRQPEGAIKDFLPKLFEALDTALKTYPAHDQLKAAKEKATKIQGKIDPNASYASWKPDFAWGAGSGDSDKYLAWWVAFHHAKSAAAAGDWENAYEKAKYCSFRAGDIVEARFMGKWPADVQKFLTDTATECEVMFAEAKKHR